MAEAIVLRVAKLLDDCPEGGKLWGSGGEFSELKKTVSFLQSILPDAEKQSLREHLEIERWLGDLKYAFYNAEDLLEEWNLEVTRRESLSKYEKLKQQVITYFSNSKQLPLRQEIIARAGKITARLEAIAAEGRDLGLRECGEDVRVERRERLDSCVYDEEIIGREDDKSAILNFLLDSDTDQQISFFIIRGQSGIGKTALARCVYEDDMVKKHFDLRIWVCVGFSGFHSIEREVLKIRGRETRERADDEEQLRRYLLVIDDMQPVDRERWQSLKILLMGGAQGSKILITTSFQEVAKFFSTSPSYCLEALRAESSVDLLMKMACLEEEEIRNPIKVDIWRQIVKRCNGIPLVIRMIGRLLFFKKTEAEWSKIQNEILEVSAGSISMLGSCYIYLPCHLKQCFAFCLLFPEDWVIDKQMLTSLWIAEGFVQPIDNINQDMEDIAHEYFMDLLWRNFFQDCTKDELGNVTSCKMHDSVYHLARHIIKGEYCQATHEKMWSIYEGTRHLSWDSTLDLSWELPPYLVKGLRTFIKTDQTKSGRCGTQMDEETLHKFLSKFKLLRVLDWHDSGIEKLPDSICELKHLAFLDLSENEGIVRLPNFMTRLQTLQVLKLNKCNKLIELPNDFRKLVNLRQLEISDCNALSHMPQGLGQLTLLHTLTDFFLPGDDSCSKNCGGLGELNRLSNLRGSIRIEVKGEIADAAAESNAANLKKKDSLVSLVLQFAGKESDEVLLEELQPSLNLRSLEIRGYGGAGFPSWISRMPKLVSLVLQFAGKESDEVLLEELQPSLNLRSLEIRGYGGAGFPSWISRMPKLVELRLFHCTACKSLPPLGELTSLMHLEIGALPIVKCTKSDLHALSSLPNLSALRIWECPNLKSIPPLLDLKELVSLQTSFATIEQVIGIDDRVKEVIKLLAIEDDGGKPRMVGIHGTNGIGKTTIAKAIYNRLSSCFDSCSFLAEIGEKAQINGGIQFLQTKLIRDILNRDGDVASFEGGIKFFLDVFSNIKALIVLDDVEYLSHLYGLVGTQLEWFGPGSRIIVTSENRGILETYVFPERANIYEVNKMDKDRALELFHKHASIPWYPEIGKRIVKAMGQVPFFIEVIGSLLHAKTIDDWRKMEDMIKLHSRENLKDCREILKICYEALDEKQKQIFRDIAWFANGVDSQIASYMWPDLDLVPSYQVLMPLAKIGEDNMLRMHKLLKHLCRTIDQGETKLSRQYMHVTDLEGINGKEGMGEVEALCFDLKNLHPHTFTETDFKGMPRVRFLKLDHASMTGNFANVFPKLRWLRWQVCSTDFIATEFSLMELVILDLSWSKVTEDWGGWKLIKMEQLKVLNLTGCTDLLISPTFSSFPNLEILILEQCSQLVHLDPSVRFLEKLLRLNLKSCIELNRLPDELGALKALKELLIDETSVRIISLESASKELETLSASNCMSLCLPNGVGKLVKLRHLSLRNCHWIRKLPESISQSPLEELDISGTGIFELPDSFGNLQRLRVLKMDRCFISKFPRFIWHLHSIEEIHASSCMNIEGEIPGDIRNLKNLRILRLRNSSISSLPSEIKDLPKLETLDVLHCDMLHELPALPSSLVIVHLSPELKEKVSHLWDEHCFITV